MAETPQWAVSETRAMCLRAVFHQHQSMPVGNFSQRHDRRRMAIEVHRKNGPCSRSDGGFGLIGIHDAAHRIDIDEARHCTGRDDGLRRSCHRQGNGDDFISGTDTQRTQGENQCVCP